MNEPIKRRNVLGDMIERTRASARPTDALFQVVIAAVVLAAMLFIFAVAGLIRW